MYSAQPVKPIQCVHDAPQLHLAVHISESKSQILVQKGSSVM